jgi:hypothetical protein
LVDDEEVGSRQHHADLRDVAVDAGQQETVLYRSRRF